MAAHEYDILSYRYRCSLGKDDLRDKHLISFEVFKNAVDNKAIYNTIGEQGFTSGKSNSNY
jgi:hypothetical protein